MRPYANLNGDSGIVGFDFTDTSITVHFAQGRWTLYTWTAGGVGQRAVDQMKSLALAGRGLNAFINTTPHVRNGYSSKA